MLTLILGKMRMILGQYLFEKIFKNWEGFNKNSKIVKL